MAAPVAGAIEIEFTTGAGMQIMGAVDQATLAAAAAALADCQAIGKLLEAFTSPCIVRALMRVSPQRTS